MKRLIFVFLMLYLSAVYAQDVDFYHKKTNDLFRLPAISYQMSLDEYQLLSRNLRMQDMIYGIFVPGYVHFVAKDFNTAYTLVGLRFASYSVLAYETVKYGYSTYAIIFLQPFLTSSNSSFYERRDLYLINAAIATIGFTYLFDWIHGKKRLEKKQELIRYKYSMKIQLYHNYSQKFIPTFGVNIKF